MRPYMQIIALMLSILATTVSLNAQQLIQPLNSGYWSFGLNTGKAYQSSDLDASPSGFGVGATFGKNLYYKPGAVLDFGLRGRLNYNKTKGLSPIRNYNISNNTAVNGQEGLDYLSFPDKLGEDRGFIFSNHKTDLVEAGLEGVLTFNELKEKTGIKLSLYGGLGGAVYNVKTDQADQNGNEYFEGYASVNDRGPTREIKRNLRSAILDGVYESQADGFEFGPKAGIMPSIGAEVGFQVSPKFSIDLGHRTTFSNTDLLDGEQGMNGDNDILHYTYMGANVNINKKEKAYLAPEITILQPRDAIATDVPQIRVYAKIKNIEHATDVELLVNGQPKPFNFRKEKLSATVFLDKGENNIEIIAGNFGGEDRQVVRAFYEERKVVLPPPPPVRNIPPPAPTVYRPVVEILNTNRTIREDRIQITGRVGNVDFAEDIQLLVNGRNERFRFDAYRQEIEATVYLLSGENDIILRAFNEAGETEDRMIIVFEDRIPAPRVEITQPEPQFRTGRNTVKVVAETEFVTSKRDIQFIVNGREIRHFDFRNDCLSKVVTLEEGRNVIRIRVDNPTGFDETKVVVFHKVVQPDLRLPIVKILSPKDHSTHTKKIVELVADIAEVNRKRNVELLLNDVKISDFGFNGRTLKANLTLKKGSNKITLRVSNTDGRDAQTMVVKFEPKKEAVVIAGPVIKIATPTNNQTVSTKTITIKGEVINATASVYVNRVKLTNVTKRGKNFTATAKLKEGENTIKVTATNQGGEAEKVVKVIFKKKEAIVFTPVIDITKPTDKATVNKAFAKLEATVDGADKVEVLVNGKKLRNVSLDGNKLITMLKLKKGTNTVEVKATNSGGITAEEVTVIFRDKVEKPIKEIEKVKNTIVKSAPTSGVGTTSDSSVKSKKSDRPIKLGGKENRKNF